MQHGVLESNNIIQALQLDLDTTAMENTELKGTY